MWILLATGPLEAQVLSGRVLDEGSRLPVAGVIVTVLAEPGGATVRSTLSRNDGTFLLQDLAPGRYRLQASMIGRRNVTSDPFDHGEEPSLRTLLLPFEAIRLEGIEVTTLCEAGSELATGALVVWEEIEKALLAEEITRSEALFRFHVTSYHSELDFFTGALVNQTTSRNIWTSRDPFVSLPPSEVAHSGYVREADGESVIYGPNTDVLLSDEFRATHCFTVTRDAERPGEVGLRFEPVPGRDVPDIEGVLWLDESSAELRTLEFQYVGMPRTLLVGVYSGFAQFVRLESGGWIIRRWWLRSPVLREDAEVTRIEPLPPPV